MATCPTPPTSTRYAASQLPWERPSGDVTAATSPPATTHATPRATKALAAGPGESSVKGDAAGGEVDGVTQEVYTAQIV